MAATRPGPGWISQAPANLLGEEGKAGDFACGDAEHRFPRVEPVGAPDQFHDVSAGGAGGDLAENGARFGEKEFHVGDSAGDIEGSVNPFAQFGDEFHLGSAESGGDDICPALFEVKGRVEEEGFPLCPECLDAHLRTCDEPFREQAGAAVLGDFGG